MGGDVFVTTNTCDLHKQIIDKELELLRQKDEYLEERICGIEKKMEILEQKIDNILKIQQDIYRAIIILAVGTILTLGGVLLGRALDFGWLTGV